jgi:hypothetical protein
LRKLAVDRMTAYCLLRIDPRPGPKVAFGHKERFPPTRLSGRCEAESGPLLVSFGLRFRVRLLSLVLLSVWTNPD